jgi:hypothetical protein
VLSSSLLISVPWMSMSAASDDIGRARPADIALLCLLGAALHAALLCLNFAGCAGVAAAAGAAGLPPMGLAERKAVVISASQKTLNTAISVIAFLPPALGDRGLITVPCIIAHFAQIIMDGFLVSYWRKFRDEGAAGAAPKAAAGAAAGAAAQAAGAAAPVEKAAEEAVEDAVEWGATGRVVSEQVVGTSEVDAGVDAGAQR